MVQNKIADSKSDSLKAVEDKCGTPNSSSAIESPDQSQIFRMKRPWHRISNQKRIELEVCAGLGLSIDFAGKVIGMSSRNANRVMKEQV